ncbi:MAG: hypothetical protein K2N56_10530, partial [Oscillospiraceae bacterium]|nr:hypothetical protein [Oscillospiraceae bacterium]
SRNSAGITHESVSQTSGRGHSDSAGFSALAKEIVRAAAEKKKALLAERPELDKTPGNTTGGSTAMSSAEIKAEIEKLVNSSSDNTSETSDTKAETVENTVSEPIQNNEKKDTQKTIAEMVKEQIEKIDSLFAEKDYDKNSDKKLMDIRAKMRQGRTLSPYEQQYLASKDPDSYKSFQQIDSARKMFRCSLNSCRTKDDVISMRLSNALTALSEYKKAIRKGESGDAVVGLNAAFENELRDYSKTPGFKSLPTVAECNKFDRDIAKARKYEQEKRLEKRRLAAAKKYKKKKKSVKTPGDGKRTVNQVLSDPTSKKVLASRAKQTYCTCSMSYDASRRMNSKA